MKFGDFIENHLVPEWRSQYLDYFKGKTRLNKLCKFLETSTECQCPTDETTLNTSEVDPLMSSYYNHNINTDRHLIHSSDINKIEYQLHNNNNNSLFDRTSFGRKSVSGYKYGNYNKSGSDNEIDEVNEVYDDDEDDELRVVPLVDRLNYNAAKSNNENTPLLQADLPHNIYTSSNEDTQEHPIGHHRSMSTSILYMPNKRASLTEEHKDIDNLAKQKFIDWVDVELLKVASFYKSKEVECTIRYLVLLDQLEQLKNHKEYFRDSQHNSTRSSVHSQSATNNSQECFHHRNNGTKNSKWLFSFNIKNNYVSVLEHVHFIFNYFDMPSLPNYFWKADDAPKKQTSFVEEELRRERTIPDSPPPFISKIMIKKAICELYHTMELLHSFKVVNRTAFRKLLKKYDKRCHDSKSTAYMNKVDAMYFNASETLTKLTENLENIFTYEFEEGHRKTAITKLRSFALTKSHYRSNFLSGYLIGISCPFLIFFLLDVYSKVLTGEYPDLKYVLQLWGSWFLFVFAGLLFAVNCLVWDKYRINYKLVFELNPNDALDYKQYLIIPSTLLFVGTMLAYFSSSPKIHDIIDIKYYPYAYFYTLLFILFCPFNIFYLKARIWFIVSMVRLFLSGFYPVEFRDFFMGVLSCSLTYSISNIYMLFCLEHIQWNTCISCGPMKSHILGICACIPALWRSMQCLRRFLDTGEWFPHFANLAKYLITTLYFFMLSIYRIATYKDFALNNSTNNNNLGITAFFITVSIINSSYSAVWDVCMDWSLMQPSSDNYLLRDVLIYKRKVIYYFAIIFDVILRFQWVVYVFTPYKISHSALTAFFVAMAELIRRFVWLFFRMENEHATNVNLFRVSRVCPLPYTYTDNEIINSKPISNFVKNTLHLNIQELFDENNNNNTLPLLDSEEIESTLHNALPSATSLYNVNMIKQSALDVTQPDMVNESPYDNDMMSLHSGVSQHTTATAKPSGWQHLSKIISRAHTKEFQQRNNATTNTNNNNNNNITNNPGNNGTTTDIHGTEHENEYTLREELNLVDTEVGENALIDDDDDDDDEEQDDECYSNNEYNANL